MPETAKNDSSYDNKLGLCRVRARDAGGVVTELAPLTGCDRAAELHANLHATAPRGSSPDATDPTVHEQCRGRARAAQEDPLLVVRDQVLARMAADHVHVVVPEQAHAARRAVREAHPRQRERPEAFDVDLLELVEQLVGKRPREPVLELVAARRAVRREVPATDLAQGRRRGGRP